MPIHLIFVALFVFGVVLGLLHAVTLRLERGRWTPYSRFDLALVGVLIVTGIVYIVSTRNDPSALKPVVWDGWLIVAILWSIGYVAIVISSVRRFQRALRRRGDAHGGSPTVVTPPVEENTRR